MNIAVVHHHCTIRHRGFRGIAKCEWPKAEFVGGDGPYAVLAPCRVLTISLFEDFDKAKRWFEDIDNRLRGACGGVCDSTRHRLVTLEKQP